MADGGGFEGRVGAVDQGLRRSAGSARDIARSLERSATTFAGFEKAVSNVQRKMSDIASKMERLNQLGDRSGFEKLGRQFRNLAMQKQGLRFLNEMDKAFTKITSSLAKLGGGIIAGTFGFLIDSIKRVYELQERWTRAIGGFNMKIGGMTSGLRQAQRAATQWSGTIRGLTGGDIFEGIQLFEDFTMAMSRVVSQGDEFSRFGIQLARGFNLGGKGAGDLAATFEDMGASGKEAIGVMSELIDAANLVGVPVNQLAGDVAEANVYMARFGKEGAKSFVTAAGYARKFAMSMRELQAATEKFDLFDDAAGTAAKLNTTFGTLINSVDLMLMDDPAQRMEYIRQSLMAQGRTYDTLSVKERRYAAETMGVNEQQLATLLNLKEAGFSYQDMMEKQRSSEAKEAEAKKRMEKQLRATAQTMYAFGAAFDRITVAIAKAIRPLLEVLGLAKTGGKDFKSFGQVMESITQHIIHFFESLAENEKWQSFMRDLARGMKDVAKAVGSFIMDGRAAKWAGELAGFMHDVYDWGKKAFSFMIDAAKRLEPVLRFVLNHVKEIALLWAAWQGAKMAAGVAGGIANMRNAFGPRWNPAMVGGRRGTAAPAGNIGTMQTGGIVAESDWLAGYDTRGKSKSASVRVRRPMTAGRLARLGGGALAGGIGAAVLTGGQGGLGGAVGTGLGTVVGSFLGPIGAAIGGALGGFLGEKIGNLFGGSKKSELERARDSLKETMERAAEAAKKHAGMLELATLAQDRQDSKRKAQEATVERLDRDARKRKGKANILTEEEARAVRDRAESFLKMGIRIDESRRVLAMLSTGFSTLTDRDIAALKKGSIEYAGELERLRDVTQQQYELERANIEKSALSGRAKLLEFQTKQGQVALDMAKSELKQLETQKTKDFAYSDEELVRALVASGPAQGEAATNIARTRVSRMSTDEKMDLARRQAITKKREQITKMETSLTKLQENAVKTKIEYDEKIFMLDFKRILMADEAYAQTRRVLEQQGVKNEAFIFRSFINQNKDRLSDLYGSGEVNRMLRMSAGGVVSRPTRALIGEAGPEAVVPLRALARGKGPGGSVSLGGSAGRRMANMVTGGSGGSGGTRVQVVTSDVILDGAKVGRAVTKVAISSPEA